VGFLLIAESKQTGKKCILIKTYQRRRRVTVGKQVSSGSEDKAFGVVFCWCLSELSESKGLGYRDIIIQCLITWKESP
jgi:hypothetical protein